MSNTLLVPDLVRDGPIEFELFVSDDGRIAHPDDPGTGVYVSGNDINQGPLGDCYLLASLGGLARDNPQALQENIKDNGDGTYTVTFYKKTFAPPDVIPFGGKPLLPRTQYVPQQVTVSLEEIPGDTVPQYASVADAGFKGTDVAYEIWPAVYETAYAKWKGGFDQIGRGALAAPTMEELTGRPSQTASVGSTSPDDLQARLARGEIIVLETNDEAGDGLLGWMRTAIGRHADDVLYQNGTLIPDHAYTVVGVTANDEVVLVNPHNGRERINVPYLALERACSWGRFAFNPGMR
jgi:hypothetical protein